MSDLPFLATCPKGLGSVLQPELLALGATEARETVTGVAFRGGLGVAYRACMHSRFANRVLLQLSEFAATQSDDLYEGLLRLPWHEHLRPGGSLLVDFSGRSDDIRNTQFGARRCKDAVVDAFRQRGLARPNVDLKRPDLRLNVRLYRGKVTVAIDLSGMSLHRRGYRLDPGKAPLRENLAAAILTRAGWPEACQRGLPLIDPMCGSGTLLIEAAMMATGRAPGLGRQGYGFEGWAGHAPEQWQAVVAAAEAACHEAPKGVEIRGYDGDIRAVRRAEETIKALGYEHLIRVRPKALNALSRPSHRPMPEGLIVCNPPWGERIGETETMKLLYQQLGQTLHREFQGWQVGIVTSNKALGRAVGLRSHRQYGFNNGAIDIQLLLFQLNSDNRLATPASVSGHSGQSDTDAPDPSAPVSQQPLSVGAEMVANRLRKNQRKLKAWLQREQISCYRLYDADMPEYAVAIDLYDGQPHIAEYAPPKQVDEASASRRFDEVIAATRHVLQLPQSAPIATKRRQRQRGSGQYGKFGQRGERRVVTEGAAQVLVNLHDYLDTGLFLDHRPLRLRLAQEARGKHFLNLFCYTGVASIHAALGGATTSTSVDLSNTYLQWYRDNLALNGLSERQHRAERSDCLQWLNNCQRTYDLVLLDPPSFSNSKATDNAFDVARDQVVLIDATMQVLAPTGTLYFSNNRRGFKLDAALLERYRVTDITAQTIPEDFFRNKGIHQCWRLQHRP